MRGNDGVGGHFGARVGLAALVAALLFAAAAVFAAPRADALLGLSDPVKVDLSPLAEVSLDLDPVDVPELPVVPDLPLVPETVEEVEELVNEGELPSLEEIGVVGEVGGVVDDLLGTDGGPLGLLDLADTASFDWETTYAAPGGREVTKSHPAVALTPGLLDVTGDLVPDVLAQLEATDASKVKIRVNKLATAPGSLPLRIEAVVDVPQPGGTGIGARFGYDTRDSTAPLTYDATVGLTDGGSISVDTAVTGPGATLAQVGEVVDLPDGGAPANPKRARIHFAPVPAVSHIGLLTAEDDAGRRTSLELSTATPTRTTLDANLTEGASNTAAQAVVDRVPGALTLALDASPDGARSVAYNAAGPVSALTLGLVESENGAAVNRLEAALADLPTRIQLAQQGGKAVVDASGPIGITEVAGSNGVPLRRLEDDQYLYQRSVGGEETFAARIRGLRSAELDTGESLLLELASAGGPFRVLQEDGERRLEASVEDLPSTVSLTYDAAAQRLDYEGSARVGRLIAAISDPAGISGSRATALDLELRDLPTALSAALGGDGGTIELDGKGGTIGLVQGVLTSGPAPSIPDDADGVAFTDVPGAFVAGVRLTDLRRASVNAGDAPELLVDSTAGRPFTVAVRRAAEEGDPVQRIDARIDALRPNTRVAFVPEDADPANPGPRVQLSADETTGALDVEAENLPGLGGVDERANLLRATLRGLPRTLDLGLTDAGGGLGIDAGGETLGLLEVLLTSGPDLTLPAEQDGLKLVNTPERYSVFARVTELRSLEVLGTGQSGVAIDSTAGREFVAELDEQENAGAPAERIRARIDALRPNTRVGYVADGERPGLRFAADERTNELTLTAENVAGLGDRANHLRATLRDLPTQLDLALSQDQDELAIDAGGEVLGLLDVLLTSGPEASLPEGTDGLVLRDLADEYVAAARLTGLREVRLALEPDPALRLDLTGGRPFLASLEQQDGDEVRSLRATIDMLQPGTEIGYVNDDAGPRFRFAADEETGEIVVTARNFGGIADRGRNLDLTLREIPTELSLGLEQAAGEVGIDAGEAGLGFLEVSLRDDGEAVTLPPEVDGLKLVDTADRYALFARVTELRKVAVAFEPSPALTIDTGARRAFRAELDTQPDLDEDGELDGDAPVATVRASIDELKPNTRVAYSDEGGSPRVSFAADEVTNAVDLTASNLSGLGDRLRNIALKLRGIPTQLDLDLDQTGGRLSIDANGAELGLLEAALSSDDELPTLEEGVDGLLYEDLDDRFRVFARLAGLRQVAVTLEPQPSVSLNLAGGRPFVARVAQAGEGGAPPTTLDARIDTLQPVTQLTLVEGEGGPQLTFAASGPTDRLTVNAQNLTGLGDRAAAAHLLLEDIPVLLDVSLATESGEIGIDAGTQGLGLLQASVHDGDGPVTLPAEVDGLKLVDTADRFALFARVNELRRVAVALEPSPSVLVNTGTRRPFAAEVDLQADDDGDGAPDGGAPVQAIRASIDALQPNTSVRYLDEAAGGPALQFRADAPTGEVRLTAQNLAGLGERAKDLSLLARDLPTSLDLSLASAAGQFDIDAGGEELGLLEVSLHDGQGGVAYPASTDGLKLVDTTDRYALFARLTALRRVQVTVAPSPQLTLNTGTRRPFRAEIDDTPDGGGATQVIRASIDALQANTRVAYVDSASGPRLEFAADQPTGEVLLSADNLSGLGDRANQLDLVLRQLPRQLDLGLSSADGTVEIDANGEQLGFLEVLLTDGLGYALDPARDGVALIDTNSRYTLFGRLRGLRRVSVQVEPTPQLELRTAGGRVFQAQVQTQEGPEPVQTINAEIDALRPDTDLAFVSDGAGQRLNYQADARINAIRLDGDNLAGLDRAKKLDLDLVGMPPELNLDFGDGGNRVSLDTAGQDLGSLNALITSGPVLAPASSTSRDGLRLVDTTGQFTLAARVTGLRKITAVQGTAPVLNLDATGNRIFEVNLNNDGDVITATLNTLKRNTRISVSEVNGRQDISYDADANATRLDFAASGINASISDPVPRSMDVCQATDRRCGGSGRTSNGGSARLIANQETTLNLTSDAFRVTNMRVTRLTYDAHVESAGTFGSGARGHIYLDTDNHLLNGDGRVEQDGIVDYVQLKFRNVRANNRLGKFKPGFLGFGITSDGKSGSISCGSGTDLYAQTTLLGLRVGLTNLLC